MSDFKARLEKYKSNIGNISGVVEGNGGENKNTASIEQTGFNIIQMIKSHLSHGVPLMFHVVEYYSRVGRKRGFNKFLFLALSYIGQLIDMLFSIIYGILMIAIALIVVIAIARGVGLGDYLLQIIEAMK